MWIDIEDKVPDPGQPITAVFLYQGKEQEVGGKRDDREDRIVLFDFYSGTGTGTILRWKPRVPPNKPDAHPWVGIYNRG